MIESAEPERRGVSDVHRAMPVQTAGVVTRFFLYQHFAYETSSRNLDGKPWQGTNEIRHQPGVSHEVATATDVGFVVPKESETAGAPVADDDSLRRKVLHLVHEGLEADLDDPLPDNGRNLIQDEAKSASCSEAGRRRLAESAS